MVFDANSTRDLIDLTLSSTAAVTIFLASLLLSSLAIGALIDTLHHWTIDEIYDRKACWRLVDWLVKRRQWISGAKSTERWPYSKKMNDEKYSKLELHLVEHPKRIWELYELGGYLEEFLANASIALFIFTILGFIWLRDFALIKQFVDPIAIFVTSAIFAVLLFLAGGIVFYESAERGSMLYAALEKSGKIK